MDASQNSRLIPALLAIFLIAACERQTYEPGSPEYVVHALYKASARGMPKEPEKLSQYFDGRMTELLYKDFTCIENGEPCGLLYFDPIAQSRTPDIDDLKIFKPEDSTEVFVSFMQRGVEYKAICVMVRTAAGWRISDIMYYGANQVLEPAASLLTHLALQTPLPAPWHPPVPGMSDEELEMLHL